MRCSNWCLAIDRSIAFNTFQEAIYPIHWFIHVVNIISRYISNTLPKCHKQTSKIHKRMEYVFVAHIKYLLKTERYVCIMSGTRMVRSRVKNRMSSIVQKYTCSSIRILWMMLSGIGAKMHDLLFMSANAMTMFSQCLHFILCSFCEWQANGVAEQSRLNWKENGATKKDTLFRFKSVVHEMTFGEISQSWSWDFSEPKQTYKPFSLNDANIHRVHR